MADADGDKFDAAAVLNFIDDHAQVTLKHARFILALRGIVHGRAIGNHHHYAALFWPCHESAVRPFQRFAVNIFLQKTFAHHQAKITLGAAPRHIGRFINDMAYVIQAARRGRLSVCEPILEAAPAFPCLGREA